MTVESASGWPSTVIHYVVIDDEPAYRGRDLAGAEKHGILESGNYPTVDAFLSLHRAPVHVVVLDLCLNRQTGDAAVLQGVRAVRLLTRDHGLRVVVHTADERAEPVARCIAAGAAAYVSKYLPTDLAEVISEVGRHGAITTPQLEQALRDLVNRTWDVRLSAPVEQTLQLLGRGLSDAQVAERRHLSSRTVEDHKRKILEEFGVVMEAHALGFEGLARELGITDGDLVNDSATGRPARGILERLMPWAEGSPRRRHRRK